ncbi:MAG: CehA/McbA family metallohydrolase [Candidatus Hydrogenedentota bacterium]
MVHKTPTLGQLLALLCVTLMAGCATTPSEQAETDPETDFQQATYDTEADSEVPATVDEDRHIPITEREPDIPEGTPQGTVDVTVRNVFGRELPSRVRLDDADENRFYREAPEGTLSDEFPEGSYTAYIYVYSDEAPILAHVEEITVREEETTRIDVELLEGSDGETPLWAFDQNMNLVLDRVESELGMDREDPSSIPGEPRLEWENQTLSSDAGWYKGELHARSEYGGGTESVGELIERAEQRGLDFLAITDRNTMESIKDPEYHSDDVVLIPAMEWGTDDRGVALIYGPRTFPHLTHNRPEAQALARLVQAQGGAFAVAHPTFPAAPWQWGLNFANAVEVWLREWRGVPPLSLEHLDEESRERADEDSRERADEDTGRLVHSVAQAAATGGLSANGQAGVFYNHELRRGLRAGVIGGSMSGGPHIPLGEPVTHVYAEELSVEGILEGIRMGRTYVSRDPDGPIVRFHADAAQTGQVDVMIGGMIPLGVPTDFEVLVSGARGNKLQVLLDGRPILSKIIEEDEWLTRFTQMPEQYARYQVRVVDIPEEQGFGPLDVHALSSPIYAHDVFPVFVDPERGLQDTWIRIHGAPDLELEEPPDQPGPEDQIQQIDPDWRF